MARGRIRRAGVAVALVGLAACGSTAGRSASVDATRPAGSTQSTATPAGSPAPTSSPAASPTTGPPAGTSDVTLAGATQETAGTAAGTSTTVAPSTVPIDAPTPAGYARAADPEGLVSVAVPSSWTFLTLDDKTLQDLANQSSTAFPEATRAQMAAAVAAAGDYIKVFAIGPAHAGTAPTLNVIITPAGQVPLSVLKAVYGKQLASAGSTVRAIEDITLGGRPALHATVEVPVANGGVLVSHQLVVPLKAKTAIVSVSNIDDATLATIIDAVVIPPAS